MQTTGYRNWPGTRSSLERTTDLEAHHAFNMTQKELLTYPTVLKQISIQVFQMKGKRRKKKKRGEEKSTGNNTPPRNATSSHLCKKNQSIKPLN